MLLSRPVKHILLIAFGALPYLLLLISPPMSELYGIWLDVGWLFIAAGFVGLRIPRDSTAPGAELLTRARAAPPAMHR